MSAKINNFVTVRKNRGDLLTPAQFRSIYEMIDGTLKRYDFSGLNEAYQDFLRHVADHDDPHDVTSSSFYPEVLEVIYSYYILMKTNPVSFSVFQTDILPTAQFPELLRRIILNRYLYTMVKNVDGSVNPTVSVTLTRDWGYSPAVTGPVTLTVGAGITTEAQFIAKGLTGNLTPIPAIFTAEDLQFDSTEYAPFFHSSRASPTYAVNGISFGTMISLYEASNDFVLDMCVTSAPSVPTMLWSMTNGVQVLSCTMDTTRQITIRLGSNVLFNAIACDDGKFQLSVNSTGSLKLVTSHNAILTTTNASIDMTTISPFVSMQLLVDIERPVNPVFSVREITLSKKARSLPVEPSVLPVVIVTPASGVVPVTVTSSGSISSPSVTGKQGYNLYLTLRGTWTGSVRVTVSHDEGTTWNTLTDVTRGWDAVYAQNCDEVVTRIPSDTVRYRVTTAIASGSVQARLAL